MLEVIEAKGGYAKTTIIRDVSIKVQEGEVVALMGRNGVGKSTLMRYITSLIPSKGGSVWINGEDAPASTVKRARMGLGYVPQGRFVFERMTVSENIVVAAEAQGHNAKAALETAYDYFPLIKAKANDLAGGLSGGQQQILAMARALATQPKFVLLDEPTEGVQPSIVGDMADILLRVSKEMNIGVLVAEQNLDFCFSAASRAYVMSKGGIQLETDTASLRKNKELQMELLGV
ncbi:High-affinity branched-chain amino acid transport ATP-binding protein LivF [Grimontia celer]|uniref:High-affinity branched-chain amino acid transport ATP-binding protein LivF n=1 Tax=Grimontia celer TaxID=1796497 RepID=A0A128EUT2_9GAMM|nr:ABC transporter ATP-binding protein [Grimontia celer]CZF78357.1 High-affinity branched-chain amino acid transport ATP-binding protein LivF [Grimontia celer]